MKIVTIDKWKSIMISVKISPKFLKTQLNLIFNLVFLFLYIGCNDKPKHTIRETKSHRVFNEQELHFDNGIYKFNPEELSQWSELEKSKIEKIEFGHFDSIPTAFDQFPNVETIELGYSWQNIYVPDIFPNLKRIELFMGYLTIEKNARFKKTLLEIYAEKSKIKSINSFSELPNLKIIDIGYSQFSPFPTDLNKLQNLEKIILGVYMGPLDISDLRLSELKSLKRAVFHTYSDNTIIGFPKDILDINPQIELEITHSKLTNEQKKILKRFKKVKY